MTSVQELKHLKVGVEVLGEGEVEVEGQAWIKNLSGFDS